MQARQYSRSIDIQLFLLSFIGAGLAILPLIPGWRWLYRWLDLWPLAAIFFVPTALWAWMLSIPGSRRFLLACLIPPVLTAIALLGLDFGLAANVLASGPTWGVALAALLLAATRAPVQEAQKQEAKVEKVEKPPKVEAKPKLPELELEPVEEEIINLEHPLDDPNLRLIPPQKVERLPLTEADSGLYSQEPPYEREEDVAVIVEAQNRRVQEELENALRNPLDEILREAASLSTCALPPSARQYAENMVAAARKLGGIISDGLTASVASAAAPEHESFNLQRVLRNAHDSVAASAEYSGIALSWYMPPHLEQIYQGDAAALESTLAMLLESSVRSAHHGAIKVSVKRVPDSSDPGHLLFTVTDDGNGYPPLDRSSLALARAWELTGKYGGYLSVECSQHGATIAFTAHFTPMEEERAESDSNPRPHIILVASDEQARRHLSRIIETLPCSLSEADSSAEAKACQTQNPAVLVICQGKFARPSAADLIREVVKIARQAGVKCQALAITTDESEWPLLKASGFTHAMLEPVDPEILRHTISQLTDLPEAEGGEPLYYHESAKLQEKPKAEAPSMVIDQSFPINPVFEGPDWLGENQEPEEQKEEPQAPLAPVPPESAGPAQPHASDAEVEWVGEPMPIGSPVGRRDEAHVPHSEPHKEKSPVKEVKAETRPEPVSRPAPLVSKAPESAIEWVGEPMPVPKAPPPEQTKPMEGELLDFIVGVQEKPENAQKEQDATVKNFVESSVNLVTSTLSDMLRQQDKSQPGEEPLKARSDPAIIALLERLDAAMRHANAAFATKNGPAIAESTGLIAADAEKFGLRLLARMAKCVERAATANDMAALSDLLPELDIAVERNRITLAQRKSG